MKKMWVGLLIGLALIIFGGLFFFLENRNESPTFRLLNVIFDFNPFDPGPGCLFVIGVILVIAVILSFLKRLF
jgi:hypothetical protein